MEDHDKSPPPKDYYKVLEVDYDATEEFIRLNYRKLALKWHPDKHKGDTAAKEKFIEINEAYNAAPEASQLDVPSSAVGLVSKPIQPKSLHQRSKTDALIEDREGSDTKAKGKMVMKDSTGDACFLQLRNRFTALDSA